MRVDEEQRVARDRAEESFRRGLLSDVGRDALQAAREAERAGAGALLAAVVVDGRAEDDQHQDDDHRFAEHLRHRCRCPEPDAHGLLAHATDDVCRRGRGDPVAPESIHRERTDRDHDDERDASFVRRAGDHPRGGRQEIADHDERRRLRQRHCGASTAHVIAPDQERGRQEEAQGGVCEEQRRLATDRDPRDGAGDRDQSREQKDIAWEEAGHAATTIGFTKRGGCRSGDGPLVSSSVRERRQPFQNGRSWRRRSRVVVLLARARRQR